MSAEDPLLQPVIVLRVVIRSPDLDTFVAKYSRFIKDDRIFIFTKSSQPPGTHVRFTLELSDGQPLIHGEGTVTRVRPESPDTSKPPGMELKFVPLDQSSKDLVVRMLKARDGTGQFREESTDAQTQVRPPVREFEERPPTLPSLPQTGTFETLAMAPALGLLPRPELLPRQDESGAVTLAQSQPTGTPGAPRPPLLPSSAFETPATIPSGSFAQPAGGAGTTEPLNAGGAERHSGSYSSPTPLPAPIPAGSEESFVGPKDGSRPVRTDRPASGGRPSGQAAVEGETNAFAALGPAPPFAEAFRSPLPGAPPPAAMPTSTVPANPFSEVSDGAIEYFVEWSLEQSREQKPRVAQASFANIKMATPHAERMRTTRLPLMVGLLAGLMIGVPLGAGAMWYVHQPVTMTAEQTTPPPRPQLARDLGAAAAEATAASPAPAVTTAAKPTTAPTTTTTTTAPKDASAPATAAANATTPATKSKPATVAAPAAPDATRSAQPEAPKPAMVDWAKAPPDPARPADATKTADATKAAAEANKPAADATKAKAAKAELQVASKPPGAAVTIDGQDRGKTPLTLTLPAGTHEVAVAKDRYATVTQSVAAPGKLDVTLKRPTATLHVDSDPAGGDVVVEGKPRGKTPVDVTLEAFHHYDVTVTLLGTKPWHKRVSLKPPQVDVTAKLSVVHTE
jgi:hypothetical protein